MSIQRNNWNSQFKGTEPFMFTLKLYFTAVYKHVKFSGVIFSTMLTS